MLLKNFIDEFLDRVRLDKNDSKNRIIAKNKINLIYKEIANNSNVHWEHLKKEGEIVSVPSYTTGTVNVTNGSRTVTGVGTSWTVDMEGRFFKLDDGIYWYRINKFVSATSLTLLSPYSETTASSKPYKIWKRYYYFPSEVRKLLKFSNIELDGVPVELYRQFYSDQSIYIDVNFTKFSIYGSDPYERKYTDGTVTLSKDSDLMNGVGTLWLSNVDPGDIVEVGTNVYRVKRVESDTAIRLLNFSVSDFVSGTTYSIKKEYNIGFELGSDLTQSTLFPYTYIKRVYDMVNEDFDKPELPEEFDQAILDGAESGRLSDMDDSKWLSKLSLYSSRIKDLKVNRYPLQKSSRRFAPKIVSRGRYN